MERIFAVGDVHGCRSRLEELLGRLVLDPETDSVVFGQTPFREPFVDGIKIGIDTGAVYGGLLTCLELPAMRFHTA